MQPKTLFLFFIALALSIHAFSQQQINIATGLSVDMNNKGNFVQTPVYVQWFATNPNKIVSFFVYGEMFFPVAGYSGSDSAFSVNTQPNAIKISKTIYNYNLCLGLGLRFKTFKINNGYLFEELTWGLSYQKFTVNYKNYNSTNYDILNPDKGLNNGSFFCGFNIGYKKNNWVLKLSAQTPPFILRLKEYPVSYNYAAPLQLTIGYGFNLQKHKK